MTRLVESCVSVSVPVDLLRNSSTKSCTVGFSARLPSTAAGAPLYFDSASRSAAGLGGDGCQQPRGALFVFDDENGGRQVSAPRDRKGGWRAPCPARRESAGRAALARRPAARKWRPPAWSRPRDRSATRFRR